MDVLAHGLWTYAAFSKRKDAVKGVLFGIISISDIYKPTISTKQTTKTILKKILTVFCIFFSFQATNIVSSIGWHFILMSLHYGMTVPTFTLIFPNKPL